MEYLSLASLPHNAFIRVPRGKDPDADANAQTYPFLLFFWLRNPYFFRTSFKERSPDSLDLSSRKEVNLRLAANKATSLSNSSACSSRKSSPKEERIRTASDFANLSTSLRECSPLLRSTVFICAWNKFDFELHPEALVLGLAFQFHIQNRAH